MISVLLALSAFAQTEPTAANTGVISDGLSARVIQRAYERLSPAICVVSYSMEITNPNTGELSRRGNRTVGLIVSPEGLVIAHGHMVLHNRQVFNVKVTVGENESQVEYDATLLRKPEDVNVAFLMIEPDEPVTFPFMKFQARNGLALGSPLFFVGIMGPSFDYARSIQTGRVGAVLKEPRETFVLDQPVSFGYVGGPVVDATGQAVGVIGFDLSSQEGGELYTRDGHPLIYQASLFQEYIEAPPGDEIESDDAWLGIFTQPLTDDLAEYWGLRKDGGIVVSTVIPGSPAEVSGLRPGDVLTEFNGRRISAKQDQEVLGFTKMVRESPIGQMIPMSILRNGESMQLELTMTTRPRTARDAREYVDEQLGLTVREITTDVRIAMNLSGEVQGVIVHRVRPGSPANQARLRPPYIVLAIDEKPITGLADYEAAVAALRESKPAEVTLFCRIGATTAFFRLQPRWEAE